MRKPTVRIARLLPIVVAAAIGYPGALSAQTPPPGSFEVAGGVQWSGAMGAGDQDATETASGGGSYRLFATRSTLSPALGVEGRVAVRVTGLVDVGFSTLFAKSNLKTAVTSDAEGIPDVEVTGSVTQVVFEGFALVNLPSVKLFGRAVPFASGGVGLLRHLPEGRTVVETGAIYHVGAGLTYVLKAGSGGLFASTGLRADGRIVVRRHGVAFDSGAHVSPAFGVTFFGRF